MQRGRRLRDPLVKISISVAWGAGELPQGGFGTDSLLRPTRALRARPRCSPRTIARGRARGRERSEGVWWGRCRSRSPRRGKRAGRTGRWGAEGRSEPFQGSHVSRVGSRRALLAAHHRGRAWEPFQGSHIRSERSDNGPHVGCIATGGSQTQVLLVGFLGSLAAASILFGRANEHVGVR